MEEQVKIRKWATKIRQSIDSSKNALHIRTCINMIAQFELMFIEDRDFSLDLKIQLDEKAIELGLLVSL